MLAAAACTDPGSGTSPLLAPSAIQATAAPADNRGIVTLNFDLYPLNTFFTPLATDYVNSGITFIEGAFYCYQAGFGNFVDPPSAPCAAVPSIPTPAGDRITFVFASPVSAVGAYVANKIYDNALTCYDGAGAVVANATLAGFPSVGQATYEFLGVAAPGIVKCTFASVNNTEFVYTFLLDNLSFDPTTNGRQPAAPGKRPPVPSPPDKGSRSEYLTLCAGSPAPSGYIAVDFTDRRTENNVDCRPADGRALSTTYRLFSDKAIGFEMGVCASEPTPAGWVVIGYSGRYPDPGSIVPVSHFQNYADCTLHNLLGVDVGGGKVIQRVS